MANRIKGITVEIGGDTTKLSKALEGVNKDIKGTQTQLKDVQKLLKLDPSNTELLSQKHKLLADAVTATKEKLEVLKTAAEQANTALANGEISQQQYDALQREIIETENELKRLTTEANQNFSMVTRIVDRYGTAVIFKNNKPRYEVRMIEDTEEAETASDEEVLSVSKKLMKRNAAVYEELAK